MNKKLFSPLFAALLIAVSAPHAAFASGASVKIGGYDMMRLADATLSGLVAKGLLDGKEAEEVIAAAGRPDTNDPLVAAASFVAMYRRLGDLLVQKEIVERSDILRAEEVAHASGGIKAGGANPVVLAASFLDILVKKGLFSLVDAQKILDDSRASEAS